MWKPKAQIQSKLENFVSEVLFYVWDPIGVNGMPSCRDEYDNYVPIVVAYLRRSYRKEGLTVLLRYLAQDYIGVDISRHHRKKRTRETQRILLELCDDLKEETEASRETAPSFPEGQDFAAQVDWSKQQAQLAVA